jgi:hypothetical protein
VNIRPAVRESGPPGFLWAEMNGAAISRRVRRDSAPGGGEKRFSDFPAASPIFHHEEQRYGLPYGALRINPRSVRDGYAGGDKANGAAGNAGIEDFPQGFAPSRQGRAEVDGGFAPSLVGDDDGRIVRTPRHRVDLGQPVELGDRVPGEKRAGLRRTIERGDGLRDGDAVGVVVGRRGAKDEAKREAENSLHD